MTCTTCNKPANAGYVNHRADERCCDPCHGPHLVTPSEAAHRFVKFHGRKARKMMRWVAA